MSMFENIKSEVFIDGLISPEGPSFSRDGKLYFVDWDAQNVYAAGLDGEHSVFAHTGGVPTGSKFHKNGHLFVADGDLGILDIAPDGSCMVAADSYQGERFKGPNDLVFAPNGDLYFTDPKGSSPDEPIGKVYILRESGQVELFAEGFQFPNGIVFSDDGKLYLAETFTNRVYEFELDAQGYEKSRRLYAQMEGGLGPDGMAFDVSGNLYAAHFGKGVVSVINPAGEVFSEFQVGAPNVTNLAFWEDFLYVTEVSKGQILKLNVGVEGQRLFGLS